MNFINLAFLQKHKSLVQNSFFVFSLNALQRLLGLAMVFVLVRTLDQSQFGDYQFILSLVGILTIFSLPGLTNAVMQSSARGLMGTYRASLKPSLLFSLLGSLILFVIGTWYLFFTENDLYLAFYISSIFFPLAHSLKNWKAVITGEEKFSSILVIEGLFTFITTCLIIGISLVKPGVIIWPLLIVLLVPSIKNLIFTGYLLKKINCDAPIEEGSLSYGMKTTVYSSLNIIANHLDKLLIYFFISPTSLAIYFVAERMSELTKSIGQNLAAVLAPRFAKMENYTDRVDKVLNIFSIGLGVAIIIFALTILPWIMGILFGEKYIEAIPFAQVLLCSVAISNFASLKNRFINSKLDGKSNRDITIWGSLIRIAASAILVPFYGIWGAVIATFIYRIFLAIIVSHIIRARY